MSISQHQTFVITNHTATPDQVEELRKDWAAVPVYMDDSLQHLWADIPPAEEAPVKTVAPIVAWIRTEARRGDLVWVQGEPWAQTYVVQTARAFGLQPIHATTRRVVAEEEPDSSSGVVTRKTIFKHVRFRPYPSSQGEDVR